MPRRRRSSNTWPARRRCCAASSPDPHASVVERGAERPGRTVLGRLDRWHRRTKRHRRRDGTREPPEFRNTALSDALQTQDIAAVAFALRHGPTVVPLTPRMPRQPARRRRGVDLPRPEHRRHRAAAVQRRRPQARDAAARGRTAVTGLAARLPRDCTRTRSRPSSSTSRVRTRCRRARPRSSPRSTPDRLAERPPRLRLLRVACSPDGVPAGRHRVPRGSCDPRRPGMSDYRHSHRRH